MVALQNDEATGLGDATPAQLATALAWRSAAYGARRTGRAVRRMPRAVRRVRRTLPLPRLASSVLPEVWARAAERGFSLWSTDSRWSLGSIKSHTSAFSVWSLWSGSSVASIGSLGSVGSLGSAGSMLSIGSAGSILSIGSAGSVLAIGGVNQTPWNRSGGPDAGGEPASSVSRLTGDPAFNMIERGGTLLGVLALAAAATQGSRRAAG